MQPLLCHSDHRAWQQRVHKERSVSHSFYKTRGLYPAHTPQSPFSATTAVGSPGMLNGPFESRWFQEVRGKYARPVLLSNGVFKLRPEEKKSDETDFQGYKTAPVLPAHSLRPIETHTAPATPHLRLAQTPVLGTSAVTFHDSPSPLKSTRYMQELESLVKVERRRRVMAERKLRLVRSEQRARSANH